MLRKKPSSFNAYSRPYSGLSLHLHQNTSYCRVHLAAPFPLSASHSPLHRTVCRYIPSSSAFLSVFILRNPATTGSAFEQNPRHERSCSIPLILRPPSLQKHGREAWLLPPDTSSTSPLPTALVVSSSPAFYISNSETDPHHRGPILVSKGTHRSGPIHIVLWFACFVVEGVQARHRRFGSNTVHIIHPPFSTFQDVSFVLSLSLSRRLDSVCSNHRNDPCITAASYQRHALEQGTFDAAPLKCILDIHSDRRIRSKPCSSFFSRQHLQHRRLVSPLPTVKANRSFLPAARRPPC